MELRHLTTEKERWENFKRQKEVEEKRRWENFQFLMGFADYLVHHNGVAVCRALSEKELKSLDIDGTNAEAHAYDALRFDDVEKIVRRYLQLPSKEESVAIADKMVRDIQEKHRKDRELESVREALPRVPD